MQSERTQGFAADPIYMKGEVFAYVGLPQNPKDQRGEFRRKAIRPARRDRGGRDAALRCCVGHKGLRDFRQISEICRMKREEICTVGNLS